MHATSIDWRKKTAACFLLLGFAAQISAADKLDARVDKLDADTVSNAVNIDLLRKDFEKAGNALAALQAAAAAAKSNAPAALDTQAFQKGLDSAAAEFTKISAALQSDLNALNSSWDKGSTAVNSNLNQLSASISQDSQALAQCSAGVSNLSTTVDEEVAKLNRMKSSAANAEAKAPEAAKSGGGNTLLLIVTAGGFVALLAFFQFRLGAVAQEAKSGKEAVGRLAGSLAERMATIEAASKAVEANAAACNQFMRKSAEEVRQAVTEHFNAVTSQLKSSKLAEAAADAHRSAKIMAEIEVKAGAVEHVMSKVQEDTMAWMKKFDQHSHVALEKIGAEANGLEKAIWPAPFLANGPLSATTERIRQRASAGDSSAAAFMLSLGELRLMLQKKGLEADRVSEMLDRVGALAYEFWSREPGTTAEATFEAVQSMGIEINKLLTGAGSPINVRTIMPKASFDMATMLSTSAGGGLRVREPLSWVILSRAGDQQKVLVNAKVATD